MNIYQYIFAFIVIFTWCLVGLYVFEYNNDNDYIYIVMHILYSLISFLCLFSNLLVNGIN